MSDVASNTPAAASPVSDSAPASAPATSTSKPAASTLTAPAGARTPGPQVSTKPVVPTPAGASAQADASKDAAVAAAKRRYQLKVDGQMVDREFTDDEITINLQKGMAADKRMAEAAEVRKQAKALFERLKADPFEAMKDPSLGIDLDKLAEERLIKRYQESQLPEPERRAAELERKLQEQELKLQKFEQARQAQEQEVQERRLIAEIETQFGKALEGNSLPNTPYSLRLMAEIASQNLEHGVSMTPSQLASEVRSHMREQHGFLVQGLEGDALADFLGEETVRKVLRHSLAKHKAAKAGSAGTETTAVGRTDPRQTRTGDEADALAVRQAKKTLSMREFREFARKGGNGA